MKILGLLSLALLLAASLTALPRQSRADDSGDNKDNKIENQSNDSQDYHINATITSSDQADQEQEQENEDISNESSVNKDLKDLGDIEKEVKLEKVVTKQIKTYGDVIDRLNGFKDELAKIKANAAVSQQADPSLTPAEKALLDKLLSKHQTNFTALNARISDLETQINDLIALLTPMADQPISPQVKSLIYGALSDLRSEISDVANLESLNIETLNQETL